ncbi:MAG: radical SAM protein [Prevotella sp.]|nr:radical SAM protein [Prevotella sp.]
MEAPLIGISRHRIMVDGKGITTLVAFHGCPLRCRYCLNRQCLEPDGVLRTITPEQLLEETRIDDLYFQATGGGITFGGGEPLLRSAFIEAFCHIAPTEWNIAVETSLNVDGRHLRQVFPFVKQYIIDVKDMNPTIYRTYTGKDNVRTIKNLQWLVEQDMADRICVRLPEIPDYNTSADVDKSQEKLEAMGLHDFERFTYIKDVETYKRSM